jgi:hypothetical protein
LVEKFSLGLSIGDIKFLIDTIEPKLSEKLDIIKGDELILDRMLDEESEKLYKRIALMTEDKILTQITPQLLFSILLRKTAREIGNKTYIFERSGGRRIPVFDTKEVARFLVNKEIVKYLADMLNSFTRTESFTLRVRVRKGLWRKIRFSDMDINSLLKLCQSVDETERFNYYKRIADLCLFTLGMFPEYVTSNQGGPLSNMRLVPGKLARAAHNYEEEGRRFYKLAALDNNARVLGLESVFTQLSEKFTLASRPLNYISDNYLLFRNQRLFPSPSAN